MILKRFAQRTVRVFFALAFVACASTTHAFGDASATTGSEKIRLAVLGDPPIEAQLRFVGEAKGRRVPAILVFGGFEEAGKVLDLLHPEVPVALASFDYPYQGSRHFAFPSTLFEAPRLRQAVQRTSQGVVALAHALATDPRIDPARIAVVGASFGAPFAVRAAAESADVSALVLVHGFADVRGTLRSRLAQLWSRRLGQAVATPLAGMAAWAISAYLDGPEPALDAARLRREQRIFVLEAESDSFIPTESRVALWEAVAASPAGRAGRARRLVLPGDHLMPGQDEVIRGLMGKAVSWLRGDGWFVQ